MATTINYANLVLKDKNGNIGTIKTFSANDVQKIQQGIDDVALIVDDTTHTLITADTTKFGATKIADATALAAGTANLAVDAAAYKALKDAMTNGVHYKGTVATYADLPTTDVEAGDMYNVTAAFTQGGVDYPAGTNVIADTSGSTLVWDVLDGDPSGYAKQAVANTFTAANTFNNNVTVVAASGGSTPAVDLTGANVTVATQTAGDNSTKAASTAYVDAAVETLQEGIINYAAAEPSASDVDNNSVVFFPATDLLS